MKWTKYIFVLVITLAIFGTAFLASNIFTSKKLARLESIQDTVATDILSSELRFALLERSSCEHVSVQDPLLLEELGIFGERLIFMEEQLGTENKDVRELKKFYSLLQIKDYLLTLNLSEKCDIDSHTILYFYSEGCRDCERQGYVLTALREKYPELRVYSFDYNLDISALNTLISVYGVGDDSPVLVIDEESYGGLKSIEDIEMLIPELEIEEETTTSESVGIPTESVGGKDNVGEDGDVN